MFCTRYVRYKELKGLKHFSLLLIRHHDTGRESVFRDRQSSLKTTCDVGSVTDAYKNVSGSNTGVGIGGIGRYPVPPSLAGPRTDVLYLVLLCARVPPSCIDRAGVVTIVIKLCCINTCRAQTQHHAPDWEFGLPTVRGLLVAYSSALALSSHFARPRTRARAEPVFYLRRACEQAGGWHKMRKFRGCDVNKNHTHLL